MAERPVERDRLRPAQFEPALEHDVVLALVGAVLLDRRDELGRLGMLGLHGLQHPVERGVPAVLVIDVDRPEKIEIPLRNPSLHCRGLAPGCGEVTLTQAQRCKPSVRIATRGQIDRFSKLRSWGNLLDHARKSENLSLHQFLAITTKEVR